MTDTIIRNDIFRRLSADLLIANSDDSVDDAVQDLCIYLANTATIWTPTEIALLRSIIALKGLSFCTELTEVLDDLSTCDATDCNKAPLFVFQLDIDPGSADGPSPDIWTLRTCSQDHADQLTEYMQ